MLPRPHLPRRTAIALGAAGLVAVAGCDLSSADGSGDADPAAAPETEPDPDPGSDEALVDEVLAAITAVWALTAGRPALAAVHRAHVAALGGDAAEPPARRRVGAAAVRRREEALRADLVRASMDAESGSLARLLASMSAAVAQQVVVL